MDNVVKLAEQRRKLEAAEAYYNVHAINWTNIYMQLIFCTMIVIVVILILGHFGKKTDVDVFPMYMRDKSVSGSNRYNLSMLTYYEPPVYV